MISDIQQIRSFNRTVTRRIGVLHDHFLGRNRPLGESRLLFEIDENGLEVKELRARLGLDSGYASRLLRSLEAQGLVETIASPNDARIRQARLTLAGRHERKELDKRSDDAAASLLTPLGTKQQEQLVTAMAEVERLMQVSDITITPEPADSTTAKWCLQQYFRLLNERFEGGYDPGNAQPVDEKDFSPPTGIFLLARLLGAPVGCGSLKRSKPGIGEIKRLWVAQSARGLGLGQKLLNALEDEGRKLGMTAIRLDTNRSLTEAQALYLKKGYVEVPRYNDDPYPDHFFEKRLD